MNYKKFEVFPWNKNLELGIDIIDKQHKKLVELLNQLALHLSSGTNQLELELLIKDLTAYANYHFKTEEAIWEKYFKDDILVNDHHKEHSKFIDKILEIYNSKKSYENIIESILKYLITWLALHILDSDRKLSLIIHALNDDHNIENAKKIAKKAMTGANEVLIETILKMYESVSTRTIDLLKERHERLQLQKELEKSQKEEKTFNDAIMHSTPGILALFDCNNKLLRWNNTFEDELEYSSEELEHKNLFDFFEKNGNENINLDNNVDIEEKIIKNDGSKVIYLLKVSLLMIDGQKYYILSGTDITRLKKIEEDLNLALIGIVTSMSKALEARDPYTAGHQQRVAQIAVAIAQELGMNSFDIEGLKLGASIHDIGKLSIPSEILTKPSKLSDIEMLLIRTHPSSGLDILENANFPWPIKEIVEQHHERIDGSGYPKGLKDDEISFEAKIVAVADIFEAMSSHRPYRASLGVDKAMEELEKYKGIHYDVKIVDTLLKLLKKDKNRFSM